MMEDKSTFNKNEKLIEYLLTILFVYCNGTWLFLDFKTPMIIFLITALFAYLLYVVKVYKEFVIPNILVVFLTVFPVLACIVNFNNDINYLSTINVAITYLLLGCFTHRRLKSILDKYVDVIYFLAIVAVILNPIFLALPSLLNYFPIIGNTNFVPDNYGYYNFIVYTIRVTGGLRTQSIFWEPGAWAINLTFALFWILFVTKDSKRLTIMLIAVFLTFSTTGITAALILLFSSLIYGKSAALKRRVVITFAIIVASIFVLSTYLYVGFKIDVAQILYDEFIGKFNGDSFTALSYEQRAEATKSAFDIAKSNPLFGAGKMKENNMLFVTSSIAEISYQLGFVYLIAFGLLFRISFKEMGFFTSVIFCIVILNGEAYSFMILSSILLIYGSKQALILRPDIKKRLFGDGLILS